MTELGYLYVAVPVLLNVLMMFAVALPFNYSFPYDVVIRQS